MLFVLMAAHCITWNLGVPVVLDAGTFKCKSIFKYTMISILVLLWLSQI